MNKSADILLDVDSSVGQGLYFPEIEEPEYCNANSSALWELSYLKVNMNTKHKYCVEFGRQMSKRDKFELRIQSCNLNSNPSAKVSLWCRRVEDNFNSNNCPKLELA